MVEVSLTVGKLDASLALLLTKDHHLIEFPTILLPNGVRAGSIVKIKCDQDLEGEKEEQKRFQQIQNEILETFGTNLPSAPNLKIKNVTQTSCVLEWDSLELGTANLKNLILFKDGKKLGAIPQPLTNNTTKLSGLSINETFQFQLRLDTTAGVYQSEVIEVTTHKMTDLSGITVCMGDISANEQFTVEDIENTLKNMGANYPPQEKIKVDTTHFICTRENKQNLEFLKASDMNIPIIRPEWLKACERERRIVGVRDYYVKDCVLPDILSKNYWQKGNNEPSSSAVEENEVVTETEKSNEEQPKPDAVKDESNELGKVIGGPENNEDAANGTTEKNSEAATDAPSASVIGSNAAEDELEEVKINDSASNAKAEEDNLEEKEEEIKPVISQEEHAGPTETDEKSEIKPEDPAALETKNEVVEPEVVKPEAAETKKALESSEIKEKAGLEVETGSTLKEAEPALDATETKLSTLEPKAEAEKAESSTGALDNKEVSAEPENTESEAEGNVVDHNASGDNATSGNKKKKNKKKNKKK